MHLIVTVLVPHTETLPAKRAADINAQDQSQTSRDTRIKDSVRVLFLLVNMEAGMERYSRKHSAEAPGEELHKWNHPRAEE